jgi:hypothetical protein
LRLLEIFLPLAFNDGQPVPEAIFELLKEELSAKFGGVTAYARSPADGLWRKGGSTERDQLVIFEVMTDKVDKEWWSDFRRRVEELFRQNEILIRSSHVARIS